MLSEVLIRDKFTGIDVKPLLHVADPRNEASDLDCISACKYMGYKELFSLFLMAINGHFCVIEVAGVLPISRNGHGHRYELTCISEFNLYRNDTD